MSNSSISNKQECPHKCGTSFFIRVPSSVGGTNEFRCKGCDCPIIILRVKSNTPQYPKIEVYTSRESIADGYCPSYTIDTVKPINVPDHAPIPPQKESILQEAERLVNGPRAQSYGPASESFGRIAKIASAMMTPEEINHIYEESELTPVFICKILVALKIGRQCNKHGRDNLVDLGGYSFLWNELEDALNAKN